MAKLDVQVAAAGDTPMSPRIAESGTLEMPALARMAKLEATPSSTERSRCPLTRPPRPASPMVIIERRDIWREVKVLVERSRALRGVVKEEERRNERTLLLSELFREGPADPRMTQRQRAN